MIEKLNFKGYFYANICAEKIDELVDAVNALQSGGKTEQEIPADPKCGSVDLIELHQMYEKVKSLKEITRGSDEMAENLERAQKVLEKRIKETEAGIGSHHEPNKWIKKVCRFWNEDNEEKVVGVLTKIDMTNTHPFCNLCFFYKHCEPITADDELIYKGK